MSLAMLDLTGAAPAEAVIDVGGGASAFAAALLARGFTRVAVLDISEAALAASRTSLGDDASEVTWIHADITDWSPPIRHGLWHDRAVFHFLDGPLRTRYVEATSAGVRPGGHLIIGTFAEDGPASCSGLPVVRYGPGALAGVFARDFTPVASRRDVHVTPRGVEQPYTWMALRRDPS
jgi:SAM-dependent methyltransferase